MNKTSIFVLSGFLFMAGGAPLHAELISGVEVPSIADMKDPAAACGCGLNLDLIHERQSALRGRLGIGNDITTTVQGLERDKGVILRDLQAKHELLGQKTALETQRAQASKVFSPFQRKQLKDDIAQIDTQIAALDARIDAMHHSVNVKSNAIMEVFGLGAEQIAKIPATA